MRPDSRMYAEAAAFSVARFALIAAMTALAAFAVGFLSVPAYVLWRIGWSAGLWLVLGQVA